MATHRTNEAVISRISSRRRRYALVLSCVAVAATLLGAAAPDAPAATGDPLTAEQRAWLDEHGPLRIVFPHFPPMAIVDGETVTGGYMVELTEALALKLGIEVELLAVATPDEAVVALEEGRADLIGGAGARPDLQAVATPTEPFAWVPTVFVVNPDLTDAAEVADLAGRRVTTIPRSPIEVALLRDHPEVEYVQVESLPAGVAAVVSGEVEAFVGPLAAIGYVLQRSGSVLRPIGEPTEVVELSMWGVRGNIAVDIAQRGREAFSDGELSVMHVKWTGFDLSDPTADRAPPWLVPLLLVLLVGGLILSVGNVVLRRRVDKATAALRDLSSSLEIQVQQRTAELGHANAMLARSNDALTEYARSVAHDLRGPTAAIKTAADLSIAGVNPAVWNELAGVISNSAGRLVQLIEALLDRAKADIAATGTEGHQLRDWIADLFATELHASGTQLRIDVPDGPIDVDATTLEQALVNLISNALKYGANPGGSTIDVALRADADGWVATVVDNGAGVPADRRELIFESGFQGDDANPGRGLGLASVRAAVEEAGGSITLTESETGAAFEVRLPPLAPKVVAAPQTAAEGAEAAPSARGSVTQPGEA